MKASNKGQWYALPLFSRLGEPLHYVDVPFRRHTHQGGRPARVNSTSTCKRPASRRAATSRWPRRRPHRASRMTPESDGTEWGGATQRTTRQPTTQECTQGVWVGGGIDAPLLVYLGTQKEWLADYGPPPRTATKRPPACPGRVHRPSSCRSDRTGATYTPR